MKTKTKLKIFVVTLILIDLLVCILGRTVIEIPPVMIKALSMTTLLSIALLLAKKISE